jgi:hypothetical protein
MTDHIERRAVTIDAETKDMIRNMHFVLMDEEVGLRKQVKTLNDTVNGNGKCGLKTQVLLTWIALAIIAIFGVDNPIDRKSVV